MTDFREDIKIKGGSLSIEDGTEGAGKVLTSDVDGLATWAVAGGADTNLGNTDQTLTGARLVTMGGNSLTFTESTANNSFITSENTQATKFANFSVKNDTGATVDMYSWGSSYANTFFAGRPTLSSNNANLLIASGNSLSTPFIDFAVTGGSWSASNIVMNLSETAATINRNTQINGNLNIDVSTSSLDFTPQNLTFTETAQNSLITFKNTDATKNVNLRVENDVATTVDIYSWGSTYTTAFFAGKPTVLSNNGNLLIGTGNGITPAEINFGINSGGAWSASNIVMSLSETTATIHKDTIVYGNLGVNIAPTSVVHARGVGTTDIALFENAAGVPKLKVFDTGEFTINSGTIPAGYQFAAYVSKAYFSSQLHVQSQIGVNSAPDSNVTATFNGGTTASIQFNGNMRNTGGSTTFATFNNLHIGSNAVPATSTFCEIEAGTTAKSQLNLNSGVAPTAPVDGDVWFDGTDLKIQVSGTTYTLTKV